VTASSLQAPSTPVAASTRARAMVRMRMTYRDSRLRVEALRCHGLSSRPSRGPMLGA